MNIYDIFREGRNWTRQYLASETEIALLQTNARAQLPAEYLDLLRFSNGGEGPLALEPLWFQLYSVTDCIQLCHGKDIVERFPDFMFFGSNGGLQRIGFDLRTGPPWAVVIMDPIAGPESAEPIASDIAAFIAAIGRE